MTRTDDSATRTDDSATRTDDSATRTDDSATRTDERGDGDPLVEVTDVDHVALRVSDLERALEFYHGLLGLPVRDRERYEAGEVPYVACVAGGRHLHLVPTDDPFDPGGEHVCLLVRTSEVDSRAELDALLSALRDAGVAVEAGEPHDRYGAYGRAPAAYVRDPDGRRVELKLH